MELVIASRNVHKVREFRAMLKSLRELDLLSLVDFPSYESPEEIGKTFEENALLKATHAAKTLGKWVIADDSGIVVPALRGEPGIHSRRYAGEGATDKDNRQKLLREMRSIAHPHRQAYFECWIALAGPEGTLKAVKGISEGEVLEEERGRHGFGYDALFLKHEYGKTFAELDEQTKNRVSHRRKALDRLQPTLEALLSKHALSS